MNSGEGGAQARASEDTARKPAKTAAPVTIGRWVSGVVGLMSAAATIYGLFTDKRFIIFALLGMVCALILLFVVSRAAKNVGKSKDAFFDVIVYVLVVFVVGYFMWLMVMVGPSLVRGLTSSGPAPSSSALSSDADAMHEGGAPSGTPTNASVTAVSADGSLPASSSSPQAEFSPTCTLKASQITLIPPSNPLAPGALIKIGVQLIGAPVSLLILGPTGKPGVQEVWGPKPGHDLRITTTIPSISEPLGSDFLAIQVPGSATPRVYAYAFSDAHLRDRVRAALAANPSHVFAKQILKSNPDADWCVASTTFDVQ